MATHTGEERVWEEDLEILTPHYGIEDVPPPGETLLYAWQHTLVDVSPFVLPLIVAGAVGYSAAQAATGPKRCQPILRGSPEISGFLLADRRADHRRQLLRRCQASAQGLVVVH